MIRLWFDDFWADFNPKNNFFTHTLDLCGIRYKLTRFWPDVLIYSVFGNRHQKFSCKKLFYTGENVKPDFGQCDYSISFDTTTDPRNLRLPVYIYHAWYQSRGLGLSEGIEPMLEILLNRVNAPTFSEPRDRFCSFIFGNGKPKRRNQFFQALSAYKHVDSAGRWMNNTGYAVANKIKFLRHYKFNIAFENESAEGYTTEKILDPLLSGTIPIYWGNPGVADDFAPGSYINAMDFPSDEELIAVIKDIDQNDDLFHQYQRAACFTNNIPTPYWDLNRLGEFYRKVFGRQID
ncbi:MAG: glycosyltransferase family 10 [Cyanobacteriota bacterium]|nr:glycosyltransferase family 10 [Cyanobacteriota bacterium]